jgi:putative ABC transport system substrate-binding protein
VFRHGDGRVSLTEQGAAELARANVDVIVATAPAALAAARKATTKIPIVMVYGPDPVDAGVVSSLAHPGGNITGLTSLSADLSVKQLELLKAIVPSASRAAILWNPVNPWHGKALARVERAARSVGLSVRNYAITESRDLEAAFVAMRKDQVDGVLSLSDPMTFSLRDQLAKLALRQRLPLMSGVIEYTEAGALASYWPSTRETFRGAAFYVHRILGGARPSDLPVEQPKALEFVINLRTAKALGIGISPQVLARADRVIE